MRRRLRPQIPNGVANGLSISSAGVIRAWISAYSAKIPAMATQSLSLLSGEQIKSLKLVEGRSDENLYRASTYDL
jgi:hypothetical protein